MHPAPAVTQASWGVVDLEPGRWRRVLGVLSAAGGGRTLAVMHSDANVMVTLAREFEIPAIYLRAEDLLADAGVTAVYVGSSVRQRASLAAAALEAGKHVLVEAPLGSSEVDLHELDDAIRLHPELRAAVAVAPHRTAALREAREDVRSGRLGPIVHARALLAAPDETSATGERDPGSTAVRIPWELVHDCLAAVTYVLDSVPTTASATLAPTTLEGPAGSVSVTFTLADGVLTTIDCLTLPPDAAPRDRVELDGERGSIVLEGVLRPHEVDEAAQVSDFLRGLVDGRSDLVPLGRACSLATALAAAVDSAQSAPVGLTRAGEPR